MTDSDGIVLSVPTCVELSHPQVICDWAHSESERDFVRERLMPLLTELQEMSGRQLSVSINTAKDAGG